MAASNRFAVALLAVFSLYAQEKASIGGTVTNSVDNSPILRAHVTVATGRQRFGALTDAAGKFSFSGIPAGQFMIEVERVGFVPSGSYSTPIPFEVGAGQKKDSFELTLTPLGGIVGRVLDGDGEPVQSAQVTAEGAGSMESVTTDNRGQYRLGGLPPGRYRVKASLAKTGLPPETRTDGSPQVHYAATYAPGVMSRKEAARLDVQPGSDTGGVDIRLVASRLVKVSGKVLDAPAGQIFVGVEAVTGEFVSSGTGFVTKPDGSFVLWGLDPGKYTLIANVGSFGGSGPQAAPLEVEVGTSDIEHLELRIVAPFNIAGQIRFEDPKSRPAAGEGTTPQVNLEPLRRGNTIEGKVGPDDRFHLPMIQAERYRVSLENLNPAYVRSMQLGSLAVDGDILDLRNGAGDGPLTLLVSTQTCTISGTVSDSNGPIAGATVELLAADEDVSTETQTDAGGKYSLDDLRPGSYKLLAVDRKTAARFEGRLAAEDFEDVLTPVQLHPGEKITADLKLAVPGQKL